MQARDTKIEHYNDLHDELGQNNEKIDFWHDTKTYRQDVVKNTPLYNCLLVYIIGSCAMSKAISGS